VITFAAIAAQSRGARELAVIVVFVGGVGLAWAAGVDLLAYLPYGLYRDGLGVRPIAGLAA
ncbi:MAG: hypothetical protein GWN07_09935, partial [Actinobacteria bacterium]|nr:hypothetical protein [Actinomycetota bacterium]